MQQSPLQFRIRPFCTNYTVFVIRRLSLRNLVASGAGTAPWGGLGGTVPSTSHKDHFCKSSRTDEKKLGVWRVTSPTIFEFQPEFVTSGLQRSDLTYILSNLLFITLIFFIRTIL